MAMHDNLHRRQGNLRRSRGAERTTKGLRTVEDVIEASQQMHKR